VKIAILGFAPLFEKHILRGLGSVAYQHTWGFHPAWKISSSQKVNGDLTCFI
jgi:hypothetical protein